MSKSELSKSAQNLKSYAPFLLDRRLVKLIIMVFVEFLLGAIAILQVYQEMTYKLIFLLAALTVIAWRWRVFGFVVFLLTLSPINWINFNINRIPVLGWILTNIPHEEKVIIVFGGGYLLLLFFTRMRFINQAHILPFLLLSGILILGLLVALYFAWFPGPDSVAMEQYLNTIVVGVVIYYLISSSVQDGKRFHVIIYAMIISAVLFALVTDVFRNLLVVGYTADTDPNRLGGFFTLRFGFGMWVNPVYISSYMSLAIVFIWGHLLTEPVTWKRILWLAAFVLLTRVLILTNSRTGIYGACLGIILISGLVFIRGNVHHGQPIKSKNSIRWLGSALLIVVAGGVIFRIFGNYLGNINNPSFYIGRLLTPLVNSRADPTGVERLSLFQASLQANLAYPWGIGGQAIHTITGYNEHSFYTLILSELGWGGFALFVCFSGWCVFKCISGVRSLDEEKSFLAALTLCGITLVFIMGWGHPIIGTTWGVTLLWSLFALASLVPSL